MLKPYYDQFSPKVEQGPAAVELPTSSHFVDIVLLHGWGLHSQVWDDIVPGLLALGYRVTLIDLPGMGRSPISNQAQTLDTTVDAIIPCLPEQAFILGWSLGALVGAQLMKRFPHRVLGLVSIAMAPSFVVREDWPYGMAASELTHFKSLFEEDWQGALVRFLALQCKGSIAQKKVLYLLKHMLYFHGIPCKRALKSGLEMLQTANFIDFFSDPPADSLFILGEGDAIIPVACAQVIRSLSNLVAVEEVPGSAHMPFLDNPSRFLEILQAWLSSKPSIESKPLL